METVPALGQVGKYRLLHELDIGQPGSVFAAEEPHTRRLVVLRLVDVEPDQSDEYLADARRLVRLGHEHIASLLDVGQAAGQHFLVMDLLKGETLADRLKREHSLPLKESLRIAREIAAALAFAHGHGYIHRELSPASVWLEPSGRARLLGLGASPSPKASSLLNRLDEPGAPGYLSPEQASGEEVTAAADLFSFGCVLYQMTTGEQPFRGDQSASLYRAVVFEHPTSAREINPDIPAALDELIGKLLAKMPGERPASADAVEHRLREWLDPVLPKYRESSPDPLPEVAASKRILDSLERLHRVPAPRPRFAMAMPVNEPPRRSWLGDGIAAVLLVAGAIALYFWWKVSNGG